MDSITATNPLFISIDNDDAVAVATTAAAVVNDDEGLVGTAPSSKTDADTVRTTKNPTIPTTTGIDDPKNPIIRTATNGTSSSLSLSSSSDHFRFLDENKVASASSSSLSVVCDESLCISNSRTFNGSFSCYTDSSSDSPMMCADGYIPQIIQKEASFRIVNHNDDDDKISITDWDYFTCCPPNMSSDVNITRHCSDPIIHKSNNSEAAVCTDNTSQPHLRQMKTSKLMIHGYPGDIPFVCCDSKIMTTTNFLNITECLPYTNHENYNSGIVIPNEFGYIVPRRCDHSETGYIYPNYTAGDLFYECCNSDEHVGPYTVDSAFKGTVYPQIILSFLASTLCTILILALLVPLVKHLRQQYSRTTGTPTSASTRTEFSSYNLYLLYLALPDLILNAYLFVIYISYAMEIYNPDFHGETVAYFNKGWAFEGAFIIRYVVNTLLLDHIYFLRWSTKLFYYSLLKILSDSASTANLYLNCVISYELFILLRNNDRIVRHKPPTFKRVSLQAAGVYFFSIVIFCIEYFVYLKDWEECKHDEGCKYQKMLRIPNAFLWPSIVVTYIIPISFFFSVSITIKCRKYLPSLTRKWKELVSI